MAEEHVVCNTESELLHHKVDEFYHRNYEPQYPNYEVKISIFAYTMRSVITFTDI